ncbi:uncharacterized protein LOC100906434 [Galendromus occidentalis]|uniref:Uncharacterized protein LOC100906434 n=1 Tax=Galendromus occidentalis TaxID=34638 RepID=A0AAJ7L8U5_9ACAR|nr:uncharacterized protein LOC100906434 [Galendromus occidentalis]
MSLGPEVVRHIESDFAGTARSGVSARGSVRNLTRDWFYRRLTNGEKILRSWMMYSPSKGALFCFCCKLFRRNASVGSAFASTDGFTKWWKLNPRLDHHESSQAHISCFTQWKALEMSIEHRGTIDEATQEAIRSAESKWKTLLERFLDIIRFIAKQNLALRGHRESLDDQSLTNKGNFLELVQLLSKYDPALREHYTKLRLGSKNEKSYMSPTIQNEIIGLLGNQVRREIIEQVKEAKYFCIIFDSTPDLSHKDQMSHMLRYVKMDGKKVEVLESFIDFIEAEGKTAEELTSLILGAIATAGLDIQNCRGQAYDNASVMAGKHLGVQARIRVVNPFAQFVACSNHSLNLVGVHAAAEAVGSVTFFGTLERIFTFFSSSTGRWSKLIAVTNCGVKRTIETRWSSRYEAVLVTKEYFSEILNVLERLTGIDENTATRSDAGLLLRALESFSFLCYLSFWSDILREINDAQRYLQTRGLDIHKSALKIGALKEWLSCERDDIISNGFDYAKSLCDDLGIEIPSRRIRKRRKEFDDTSEDANLTFEQELKREMYASSDRILQEMTTRFEQLRDLDEKFGFLKPAQLLEENSESDLDHAPPDIDRAEFLEEQKRLQQFVKVCSEQERTRIMNEGPLELLQFIREFNLDICVPNIVICLRIFLTVAISSASCERSFSKLKLIKSYMRSTMSQARLSNLAILSIENEIASRIDMEGAIKEFATLKARRVRF